jgi:hypothetical protein
MSPKLHIAISVVLQTILFAGTFYSLEHPGSVAQQTNKDEAFTAGVFPGSRLPEFDVGVGRMSYRFRQWNAGLAENGASLQTEAIKRCSENSDSLYNRQQVLEQLSRILNSTATLFHNNKYLDKKEMDLAAVKNERPAGFSVHDLTDPSNTGTPLGECIEFKNTHVYHFALIFTPYSFSHVVILEDGQLKVFKAINCKKGDRLEDLISYLNQKLRDCKDKDEIINRARNYRRYGIYAATDDSSLRCEEQEKNQK